MCVSEALDKNAHQKPFVSKIPSRKFFCSRERPFTQPTPSVVFRPRRRESHNTMQKNFGNFRRLSGGTNGAATNALQWVSYTTLDNCLSLCL